MKKLIYFFILFALNSLHAQVGIGTTTPNASAVLDIQSTDKGILIPRITTINRNAMANVNGMLVYDTDLNGFYFNNGTLWFPLINQNNQQAGSYVVGNTNSSGNGWQYYNVTYATAFPSTPSVVISFREGTGTNNAGSNSVDQIKVANSSTTGFTIAIHDTASTNDVCIDWIATLKTQ